MSGPYALVAFSDVMFMGQVGLGAVDEFATLASSYQHSYGNLYRARTELFEAKYSLADTLFPATTGLDNLVAAGLLPASAVFSSTPPTPDLASITPATTPSILAGMFANAFGTDNLVTNTYRLSYIQDVLANPDRGSGPPSATPANPLRADLKINDLRNWAPVAPMLLCGGSGDLVVYYFNTQLMQSYLALNAPASPVTVLDVDSKAPPGSPYRHLTEEFSATKKLVRWIEGQSFVTDNYHDVLVPAFCIQAAKSFFEGF